MIQGLAACFTGLSDPRATRRCDHRLIDILVIAVRAVIACAESWEDIALYGRSKQAWLETFLALPNGTGIGVERRHGIDPGEQCRVVHKRHFIGEMALLRDKARQGDPCRDGCAELLVQGLRAEALEEVKSVELYIVCGRYRVEPDRSNCRFRELVVEVPGRRGDEAWNGVILRHGAGKVLLISVPEQIVGAHRTPSRVSGRGSQ